MIGRYYHKKLNKDEARKVVEKIIHDLPYVIDQKIQFVNFKNNVDKKYIDNEKNKIYNDLINESYTIIIPKSLHDDIILKHFYKSIDNVPFNKRKLKENAFLGLVFGFALL